MKTFFVQRFITKLAFISVIVASLSGCIYKLDTRQGNSIDTAVVSSLTIGMSKADVTARMGTPVLQTPLHQNRWDYVYYHRGTDKKETKRQVTLTFDGDRLTNIKQSGLEL